MSNPESNPRTKPKRVNLAVYSAELRRLQTELVAMQEWVKDSGARIVVIFEGRDAAGKGSAIKRVTEFLNPRIARIVALPVPTERERGQWYFQRYIEHLPSTGEIVLMDRSWYNRAGVEHVMGYCTPDEYRRFLHQAPLFERMLVEDGILLVKYWFSVSDHEQEARFRSRLKDPMRRWKLSGTDLFSITKWVDYSRAKDEMFVHTDLPEAPWWVVESEDKRAARLNMISHLLSIVPYEHREPPTVNIPSRPVAADYERPPRELNRPVPDYAATLAQPGQTKPASRKSKSGSASKSRSASKSAAKETAKKTAATSKSQSKQEKSKQEKSKQDKAARKAAAGQAGSPAETAAP
ncbi:polyphosphate kinase 2 [Cryobacterium sp. TMT1-21]|uniref:ADP/GDP-polyphosphate phosphotransferase n=1 Tax=Cryobacterium shii TaxID=1259235 RepID=A0AAQ2C834_9MICO|nr:polyphosphate kinase 2 [Cryobacterium shii]TFC85244.1 polyphosphate kinase 2 [Cryobacterium sp. TmT2-59]TFD15808.1 polyphosphate kinase 2 [Cryobacterium sp. TMT4-10]TFD17071.1 polyphosphate kinase 2 [Cryobacterium sp. TMT1-21]TFD18183.1 polyphosphate kinase 2 [Cryobacterium sp. TMT2-23]TFD41428.1 polyphosphate kinase 2 [Cryobacterium sp. TMT2-10]